jgi:FkbM family methyltransferase
MDQRRSREREAPQARAGRVTPVAEAHRLADGLLLWADASDQAVTRPILENRYELNELDFAAATVRSGDTVVDLGAHVGAYTLRLARLVGATGRVIAVEPDPVHVEYLRRSIADNGFDSRTVLICAAASDVTGSARLVRPPHGSSSAHAWLSSDDRAAGDLVPTVRLDDVLDQPARFIKIDIEGAEGLALRGARRVLDTYRPVLLVELHPHLLPDASGETPASLIAGMARAGYECRLLGAGRAGVRITDTPSNAVTSVAFLPL